MVAAKAAHINRKPGDTNPAGSQEHRTALKLVNGERCTTLSIAS
jgi:hypothetical protein